MVFFGDLCRLGFLYCFFNMLLLLYKLNLLYCVCVKGFCGGRYEIVFFLFRILFEFLMIFLFSLYFGFIRICSFWLNVEVRLERRLELFSEFEEWWELWWLILINEFREFFFVELFLLSFFFEWCFLWFFFFLFLVWFLFLGMCLGGGDK